MELIKLTNLINKWRNTPTQTVDQCIQDLTILSQPLRGYWFTVTEIDNESPTFWIYDDKDSNYVIDNYYEFEEKCGNIEEIAFPQESQMEVHYMTLEEAKEFLIELGMAEKVY